MLDFSRFIAGPHAGRMLVEMGADVVKVEPPWGDFFRTQGPDSGGVSIAYAQQNWGKRNISLDLQTETGREVARNLATEADILLENYRPGVMERLSLDYPSLGALNSRLIYASISGYGQHGPMKHRGAYAAAVHAEMGYMASDADYSGRDLQNEPYAHADVYAGLHCCTSILAALHERERLGTGQHVEVTMAESLIYSNEYSGIELSGLKPDSPLSTMGSPIFTTQDGTCGTVVGDPVVTFDQWLYAMEPTDLAEDERFLTYESRRRHAKELTDIINHWCCSFPDTESLGRHLDKGRLIMGQIKTLAQVRESSWAQERKITRGVTDQLGGTFNIPLPPWRFATHSRETEDFEGSVASRGLHNDEVLSDWLGLSEQQINQHIENGVLSVEE